MENDTKSPAMREALDCFTEAMFGRKRSDSLKVAQCVCCGGEARKFRNALSRKEFGISGMCQPCQDGVFGVSK